MATKERLLADQDLVIIRHMRAIADLQRKPRTPEIDKIISECRRIIAACEKSRAIISAA